MTGARVFAAAMLASLASLVTAGPARAQSAGRVSAAELWFDGKASLGAFRGVTRTARGEVTEGAALEQSHGFVEFQAATLSTDNSIRDHDMRNTLDVEKYPLVRFDLDSVHVDGRESDSIRVELVGRFTVHGVTKPLRAPAVIRRGALGTRATGSFSLVLPAYGITHLKRFLGTLTMDETIRVGFDVTFSATPSESQEKRE